MGLRMSALILMCRGLGGHHKTLWETSSADTGGTAEQQHEEM